MGVGPYLCCFVTLVAGIANRLSYIYSQQEGKEDVFAFSPLELELDVRILSTTCAHQPGYYYTDRLPRRDSGVLKRKHEAGRWAVSLHFISHFAR